MEGNPFRGLRPCSDAYQTLPILEAFNWSECLQGVECGQWYVVAFRSIRRETADADRLRELDDRAYEEALSKPGLLLYFRGSLNELRECLSVCVWQSQGAAQAATRLPSHRAAADETDAIYERFALERWILTKRPHSRTLSIRPVRVDTDLASRYVSAVTQRTRVSRLAPPHGARQRRDSGASQAGYAP